MNEAAMIVGYVIITYAAVPLVLNLAYLTFYGLAQINESPVFILPATVLIILLKIVTIPIAILSQIVPRFD